MRPRRAAIARRCSWPLRLVASAARLRREVRVGRPGAGQARKLDLVLDWFPNPDHVAIYEAQAKGYFKQVGLDVKPHVPSDPSAPIKQVAAGRADARDLLRARGAAGPRAGAAGGRGRGARPAPAHVADRDRASPASARSATCAESASARPASRTSRPTSRRSSRARSVPPSSVKETNVGASLLPAMLSGQGRRDARRLLERRGRRAAASAARSPGSSPVDRLGRARLRRARAGRQLGQARRPARRPAAVHLGRRPRGERGAARTRAARPSALLDANPDLKAKETARERARHDPDAVPGEQRRPWGYLDPVAWRNYGGWMVEQRPPEGPARHQRGDHERPAAGPGLEVAAGNRPPGVRQRERICTGRIRLDRNAGP